MTVIQSGIRNRWRRTARITTLFFVWMCTVGVLAHDDDLLIASSRGQTKSIGHPSAPNAPTADCAACEWTQGAQAGTPPHVAVPAPIIDPLPELLTRVRPIVSKPTFFARLRGPPPFTSFA